MGVILVFCGEVVPPEVRWRRGGQPQRQPDVAKITQPLETDVLQLDQHRLVVGRIVVVWRVKQRRLWLSLAIEATAQLRPAALLALLEFAELGHHAMTRALRCANRLDQRPVAVPLAVLASFQAFEKHHIPAAE